ncbi:hypothetical protein BJX68DRAFT_262805 [Aspergillus pseudodeflectus]|uniref:AAA+ ATPase domain-containing protein n=1 Tax=Aspergillus pseudodeflectus TaxID=176178 RepID=A0ABR4L458_9EURO
MAQKTTAVDLADVVQIHRQAHEGAVESIYFSHLWHLFWPGQEIVTRRPNNQVFRVIQVSGGRRSLVPRKSQSSRNTVSNLVVDCFHLDYDGKQVRPVPKSIAIRPYVGKRSVTALDVFPLQYLDATTKSDITKRGCKFVGLVKVSHKRYKGLNLTNEDFHKLEEIESDVVIDFEFAYRSGDPGIKMPDIGGGVILQPTEEDEEETHGEYINYDNEEFRTARYFKFVHDTPLLEDRALDQLEDEHLTLLPDRVFGYVLLSRKWYPLNIDLISELETIKEGAHDAFDDPVLPKKHRDIIRALVKTHSRARGALSSETDVALIQRQFDIVEGKGKGLIILLHGVPGVGKTPTAECVAAHTGRPLFPITCGDLGGNSAQEVEQNLEQFFDLAMRWGCVLLLDEADVFFGERIQGNIVQNSLEYYSGVLILTTNRVEQFDEAATSRIHCALYYPAFSKRRALEVWQKNVDRLKRDNETSKVRVELNEKRIMKFAEAQWEAGSRWNGRQIKNAFQTAVALADWDSLKKPKDGPSAPKLRTKHIQAVVKTSNHFELYLTQVRRSDPERAKMHGLRRDDLKQTRASKKSSPPKWPGAEESDSSSDGEEEEEGRTEGDSESDSESKSESEPEPPKKKRSKKSKAKATYNKSTIHDRISREPISPEPTPFESISGTPTIREHSPEPAPASLWVPTHIHKIGPHTPRIELEQPASKMTLTHDDKYLAVVVGEKELRLYDTSNFELVSTLQVPEPVPGRMGVYDFNPRVKVPVPSVVVPLDDTESEGSSAGSDEGSLDERHKSQDVRTTSAMSTMACITEHQFNVLGWNVGFSPDGTFMVYTTLRAKERLVCIWDVKPRRTRKIVKSELKRPNVTICPNSKVIAAGGLHGPLCIWKAANDGINNNPMRALQTLRIIKKFARLAKVVVLPSHDRDTPKLLAQRVVYQPDPGTATGADSCRLIGELALVQAVLY